MLLTANYNFGLIHQKSAFKTVQVLQSILDIQAYIYTVDAGYKNTVGSVMPYMVPPTVGPAGPSTAPYMVRGTIHGAVDGPAGPSMAAYMVRPDHPRRRTWSGRTIRSAMDGPLPPYSVPPGPSTAPWMVPPCRVMDFWTIYGVES